MKAQCMVCKEDLDPSKWRNCKFLCPECMLLRKEFIKRQFIKAEKRK
jgi:predicted RNA-binding Zn-ribbon protein involved in translation (DUF1610 family)